MSTATPLIVEPGFLEVYTFVDAGAVIVAENGDYATALDKILHMSPEQWGNLAMEVSAVWLIANCSRLPTFTIVCLALTSLNLYTNYTDEQEALQPQQ